MKAIQRLKQAGLTRGDIARALDRSRQAVGFWERGLRAPNHSSRTALIDLARTKGITLLASDFSIHNEHG